MKLISIALLTPPALTPFAGADQMAPEIALAWEDGREDYLPLPFLRKNCPCALCQGESDVTGKIHLSQLPLQQESRAPEEEAKMYQLRSYERVGGYALQLYWADGHQTGIYSFDYLRKLGDELMVLSE